MDANEIFQHILAKRGINDAEVFARADYEAGLHNPSHLPDVEKAVERIIAAKKAGEKVAIYGDYDIDGLTATTILHEALSGYGLEVETYIPDRFNEGYGMSRDGIEAMQKKGVKLVITVDCGSRSLEEIAYAAGLGIDVIVTDHHEVGSTLPEAVAVVNPKRADSTYPWRDLAGVGVAFKLICALQIKLGDEFLPKGQEKWLLDLVALGTVCDVVELRDENRVFVKWGLEVIKKTRRPGLRALAEVAMTRLRDVKTDDFGFRFGPRLNASGRLTHAKKSLQVLMSDTAEEANALAVDLNDQNTQRRNTQARIFKEATIKAEQEHGDEPVLVLADEGWSHGINGIVAAKLVEKFGKPSFVLQLLPEDNLAKGSARSFGDFHLSQSIDAVREHLVTGGGHALAAGVSMKHDKVDDFRKALLAHYISLQLGDQSVHLQPDVDVEVADFTGLDEQLLKLIEQLEPFGNGHEQPVFLVPHVKIESWKAVGSEKSHAKATLVDASGERRDAIGFSMAEHMPKSGEMADVFFHLELNEYMGRTSLQHRLLFIRPSGLQKQ